MKNTDIKLSKIMKKITDKKLRFRLKLFLRLHLKKKKINYSTIQNYLQAPEEKVFLDTVHKLFSANQANFKSPIVKSFFVGT